ncbi:hypothetical protein WDU94_000122, partial [Cyamophila willieti]
VLFSFQVSFIEIYNDIVIDLLNTRGGEAQTSFVLDIDELGYTHIQGVNKMACTSYDDVIHWLKLGLSRRNTKTIDNHVSSLSHVVFTFHVYSLQDGRLVKYNKLIFIDLTSNESENLIEESIHGYNEYYNSSYQIIYDVIANMYQFVVPNYFTAIHKYLQDAFNMNLVRPMKGRNQIDFVPNHMRTIVLCCISNDPLYATDVNNCVSLLSYIYSLYSGATSGGEQINRDVFISYLRNKQMGNIASQNGGKDERGHAFPMQGSQIAQGGGKNESGFVIPLQQTQQYPQQLTQGECHVIGEVNVNNMLSNSNSHVGFQVTNLNKFDESRKIIDGRKDTLTSEVGFVDTSLIQTGLSNLQLRNSSNPMGFNSQTNSSHMLGSQTVQNGGIGYVRNNVNRIDSDSVLHNIPMYSSNVSNLNNYNRNQLGTVFPGCLQRTPGSCPETNVPYFNQINTNVSNFNHFLSNCDPNDNQIVPNFSPTGVSNQVPVVNTFNPCQTFSSFATPSFQDGNSRGKPGVPGPQLMSNGSSSCERKTNAIETRKRSTCRPSLCKIDEETDNVDDSESSTDDEGECEGKSDKCEKNSKEVKSETRGGESDAYNSSEGSDSNSVTDGSSEEAIMEDIESFDEDLRSDDEAICTDDEDGIVIEENEELGEDVGKVKGDLHRAGDVVDGHNGNIRKLTEKTEFIDIGDDLSSAMDGISITENTNSLTENTFETKSKVCNKNREKKTGKCRNSKTDKVDTENDTSGIFSANVNSHGGEPDEIKTDDEITSDISEDEEEHHRDDTKSIPTSDVGSEEAVALNQIHKQHVQLEPNHGHIQENSRASYYQKVHDIENNQCTPPAGLQLGTTGAFVKVGPSQHTTNELGRQMNAKTPGMIEGNPSLQLNLEEQQIVDTKLAEKNKDTVSSNEESSELNTTTEMDSEDSEEEIDEEEVAHINNLMVKSELDKIYAELDEKIQILNANYLKELFPDEKKRNDDNRSVRNVNSANVLTHETQPVNCPPNPQISHQIRPSSIQNTSHQHHVFGSNVPTTQDQQNYPYNQLNVTNFHANNFNVHNLIGAYINDNLMVQRLNDDNQTLNGAECFNPTLIGNEYLNPTVNENEYFNPTLNENEHFNSTLNGNERFNQPIVGNEHFNQQIVRNENFNQQIIRNERFNQLIVGNEHFNQPIVENKHFNQTLNGAEHLNGTVNNQAHASVNTSRDLNDNPVQHVNQPNQHSDNKVFHDPDEMQTKNDPPTAFASRAPSEPPASTPDPNLDNVLSSCEFQRVWNEIDTKKSQMNVILLDLDTASERINELKQLLNLKNHLLKFLVNNKPLRDEVRNKLEVRSVQLKTKMKKLKRELKELKNMEEKINLEKLNLKFKKNRNGGDANRQLILFNYLNKIKHDEEPAVKNGKKMHRKHHRDSEKKMIKMFEDNEDGFTSRNSRGIFNHQKVGSLGNESSLSALVNKYALEGNMRQNELKGVPSGMHASDEDPMASNGSSLSAGIANLKSQIEATERRLHNLEVITKITMQSDEQIDELNENLSKWTKILSFFEKRVESETVKKEQLENNLVLNLYKIRSMEETFGQDRHKDEVLHDISELIDKLKPNNKLVEALKVEKDVTESDKTIKPDSNDSSSNATLSKTSDAKADVTTEQSCKSKNDNTESNATCTSERVMESNTSQSKGTLTNRKDLATSNTSTNGQQIGTRNTDSECKANFTVRCDSSNLPKEMKTINKATNTDDIPSVEANLAETSSQTDHEITQKGSDPNGNVEIALPRKTIDDKVKVDLQAIEEFNKEAILSQVNKPGNKKSDVIETLMNGSDKKLDNLLETESSIDTLGSTSMRNFKISNSTEISDNAISMTAISDKSGGGASVTGVVEKRKKKSSLSRAFSFRKSHNANSSGGACPSTERSSEKPAEKSTTGKKIKNFILNKSGDKNKSNDSIRFKKPDDQMSNCSNQSSNVKVQASKEDDKLSNSSLASKLRVIVENSSAMRDGGKAVNVANGEEKKNNDHTEGESGTEHASKLVSGQCNPCSQQTKTSSQCTTCQSNDGPKLNKVGEGINNTKHITGIRTVQDEHNVKRDALKSEINNLLGLKQEIVEKRITLCPRKCSTEQSEEKRKMFFEYDEAIETVDALIEYKGNLIRDLDEILHKGNLIPNSLTNDMQAAVPSNMETINGIDNRLHSVSNNGLPNMNNLPNGAPNTVEGTQDIANELYPSLITKLTQLDHNELVFILYKCFSRIIDLRTTTVELEKLVQSLDYKLETKITNLQEMDLKFQRHLQKNQISNEKHLTLLQKDYLNKLHLFYECYCTDHANHGGEAHRGDGERAQSTSPTSTARMELNESLLLKEENKFLKTRVKYLEAELRKKSEERSTKVEGGYELVPRIGGGQIERVNQLNTIPSSWNKTITVENNKLVISRKK